MTWEPRAKGMTMAVSAVTETAPAPRKHRGPKSDLEQCIALLERLQGRGGALKEVATVCRHALQEMDMPADMDPHCVDPADALISELATEYSVTPTNTLQLEIDAKKRAFARRREMLAGSLTATEVAHMLGTTRQTPHDRARVGALLAVEDQSRLCFPIWQFDPNGPNGVVSGLPRVLRSLSISTLGKLSWLTAPNAYLEGRTPLEALKVGDEERVVDQALAVGAH
jgi:hypothetical protein